MKGLTERFSFDPKAKKILLRAGKVEIGQHVHRGFRSIVAEELGLDIARISLCEISTQSSPNDGLTAGSLSMQVTGPLLRTAASSLRETLVKEAAQQLQSDVKDINIDSNTMDVFTQEQRCSIFDLPVAKISLESSSNNATETDVGVGVGVGVGSTIPSSIQGKRLYIQDIVMPGMIHARATRGRDTSGSVSVDVKRITDGGFSALVADTDTALNKAWQQIGKELPERSAGCDGPVTDWIHNRRIQTEHSGDTTAIHSTVTQSATRGFILHASIAPSCALARFKDGVLEIWTHSQGIFPLRDTIASELNIERCNVIVRHVPSAGTYGHSGADDAAMDAALVSLQSNGAPVRVSWTRQDDFQFAPVGAPMHVKIEAQLNGDKAIESWRQTIWSGPHGQRPGGGGNVNLLAVIEQNPAKQSETIPDLPKNVGGGAARNATPPYAIASFGETTHLVQDLPVHSSSIRGLGAHVNVVCIEAAMDKLALSCSMDPLEFRLARVEDPRGRAVLTSLKTILNDTPKELHEDEAIGISFSRYKGKAAYAAVAAKVRLTEKVELLDVWAVVDAGHIVDESGALNQIEGGIVQAASWTICEGALLRNGYVDATSWDEYPILSWADIPTIHTVLTNNKKQMPSLGLGECMVGPTSAAIVNGVSKIAGYTLADLPLTREKFIRAATAN